MNVAQLAERIGTQHGVEQDQARGLVGRDAAHEDGSFMDWTAFENLQNASLDLLIVASRAADNAERRGDEIDLELARARKIFTATARR